MDQLTDIVNSPTAQTAGIAAVLLLYRFIRVIRADSREENVQRQIDDWHKTIADSVKTLEDTIRALREENIQLKIALTKTETELKITMHRLEDAEAALADIRKSIHPPISLPSSRSRRNKPNE